MSEMRARPMETGYLWDKLPDALDLDRTHANQKAGKKIG
jgi:hypothetical protein